jgi:hypothetical protein
VTCTRIFEAVDVEITGDIVYITKEGWHEAMAFMLVENVGVAYTMSITDLAALQASVKRMLERQHILNTPQEYLIYDEVAEEPATELRLVTSDRRQANEWFDHWLDDRNVNHYRPVDKYTLRRRNAPGEFEPA